MIKRIILALLIIMLAIVLTAVAHFTSTNKQFGVMQVQGLQGTVSIYRDHYGIPHINAQNTDADAYFALGYVHAQDRLWQMIYQKHVASGTLSEIFGSKTIKEDEYLRTWGFYRAARTAWPALDARTKHLIAAYTAGVNAFLAKHSYPLQLKILQYKPQRWTVIDSIAWQKMMAWDLQTMWQSKIKNYLLMKNYDLYGINYFRPPYPANAPTILSEADLKKSHLFAADIASQHTLTHVMGDIQNLQSTLTFTQKIRHQLGFKDAPGKGSNNWVVSGKLTRSGKPLLANDPHLAIQAPSVWYLAEIRGPHFHVYGATVPGLPGVIVGHNDHIAWAVTNGDPNVQDLYILNKNTPVKTLTEVIKVRGGQNVKFPVEISAYGPVISGVTPHIKGLDLRLALKWTALMPGDTTLQSFADLAYARNWHQFVKAMSYFVAPTQNFLYADTQGNIGYYYPGKIPIRNNWLGNLPVKADSGHRWMGYIPFKNLPHVYNPPENYIISANNKVVPNSYPYQLTYHWYDMPFRAERIKQLLLHQGKLTVAKYEKMQLDEHTLLWPLLKTIMLQTKPLDVTSRKALQILRTWNGNVGLHSVAATVFYYWLRNLAVRLTPKQIQFGSRWLEPFYIRHVLALPRSQTILSHSLQHAMQQLTKQHGSNQSAWQWGKVHKAIFAELALGKSPWLAWIWRRIISTPGGDYTVNVGTFNPVSFQQEIGASYRQIIDLNNFNNSEYIGMLGQSESPLSNHYSDMLKMWRNGQYIQMKDKTGFCKKQAASCLILQPMK